MQFIVPFASELISTEREGIHFFLLDANTFLVGSLIELGFDAETSLCLALNPTHRYHCTYVLRRVGCLDDKSIKNHCRWHRKAFKLYWRRKSERGKWGRPSTDPEIRSIMLKMAAENPLWGAPTIHGDLLKLGINISDRTVSKIIRKRRPNFPVQWPSNARLVNLLQTSESSRTCLTF
jgi:hypothetical protein